MGMMDKMKFWGKGKEDDLGDLGDFSDLGDFGLPESKSATPSDQTAGLGGTGEISSTPPGGVPHEMTMPREEVAPSAGSQKLGDELGLDQQQYPQQRPPARPAQQPAPQQSQYQPQYQQPSYGGADLSDLAKDIQIVQAKLDAIRSSVDSINRRLDNLERIAEGGKPRYSW